MINRGLNVRQAERLVQNAKAASGGTRKATAPADPDRPKDTDTLALERDLTALLGLKVSIRFPGNGGSLKIGRASCRERVCQYVSISVVAVSFKQTNKKIKRTRR